MKKALEAIKRLFSHEAEEPSHKRALGIKGEQVAVKFLKKQGYTILQRNYRCNRGEIDVICYDHGTIAFVEVKTRHSTEYGPPELSVTGAKKKQITKAASHYAARKKLEGIDLRYDVVSIYYAPQKKHPEVTLFKNAFSQDDEGF